MAVKNKQKQEGQRVWRLNGEEVRPCLYNGRAVGHGKYYAAMINGALVCENDVPLHFRSVGALEDLVKDITK